MSVREYIGARYVPLFIGAWDINNSYEPLSVVINQGNSYTSRQFVPTGIDITNETYWANTGNYNAQVDQYRQEVFRFDSRITQNEEDIEQNAQDIEQNALDISSSFEAIADLKMNSIVTYDSLEEAKENVDGNEKYIITKSYYNNSNIGGAIYKVSDAAPDGYYETTLNGLYLELINADNVSQFGAKGDGVTDDTYAIQNAIDNLGVINFEPGGIYKVSNILISESDKILNGNKATLRSEIYKEGVLTTQLVNGSSSVEVSNPDDYNVNQTAFIYNPNLNPKYYQIVITGINGNTISFKSYKPFKHEDTLTDTSPYDFPAGSKIYTGTTIFSVMAGLNVNSYGIVSNVVIDNFIFEQPVAIPADVDKWGQLAYGVLCYNTENVTFSNNHAKSINALFLMFYGYHKNPLVQDNIFENANSSYAVCAHWDMQNISLNNRTHNFKVINNTFYSCKYNIIYSSVDSGLCQGNRIYNIDSNLNNGIYIYGGDIAIHTIYSTYDQESYYSKNILISDNIITAEGRKSGIGIEFLGASNCQASNNVIKETVSGVLLGASINIDVANNLIEYTYLGTSQDNCSVRIWGMCRNIHVHDNMFNTPRVMRLDSHNRTVSENVTSTQFYGYSDTTIFVENNKINQSDATSLIWVGGETETSHAPTTLKDVPQLIMFNKNTVINSAKTDVTVFQINSNLATFVTSTENLQSGQMCVFDNISYGLVTIMQKFRDFVPNAGNVSID